MKPDTGIRLAELAALTGATLDGDGDIVVTHVSTLERAAAGALAFIANSRYRAQLASTRASAVIVRPDDAAATSLPRL
ncbi:MAG TPA: LpxD N-terminal domain-containing protein, partial [Casimicrobiaceae bacterium]|nr:LpxD N-terminal domain-containing protein [Casimicrobiaceae bacterium]